jgi:hypothetical protein
MGSDIHVALQPHPLSHSEAVSAIEVDVSRSASGDLTLRYRVTGNMRDLRLPLPTNASRADELWRQTCFELFLRPTEQEHYYEFNFAPSLQWAAYRFDRYRHGITALRDLPRPQFAIRQDGNFLEFKAVLHLDRLPISDGEMGWHLGLSVVIEEVHGGLSHWALEHPPGKPDFHHANTFALCLSVCDA